MKYLKRFNESSTDEVIEHLQDICRELEDISFKVDIFYHGRNGVEYIIDISQDTRPNWWSTDNETRNNEMFLFGSVEDHFENYMKDLGYTMKVNHNLPAKTPHHITYNFYEVLNN